MAERKATWHSRRYTVEKTVVVIVLAVVSFSLFFSCASSSVTLASYHSQLLQAADSLFSAGEYKEAITAYHNIRATRPKTEESKTAHFQCAVINVYYKNINADWNEALTEFSSFSSRYPNDQRTAEALSWVRVLTVLKAFNTQFQPSASDDKRLKLFGKKTGHSKLYYLDSMSVIIRNCYDSREAMRDSMAAEIENLKNVIINLEKKCQQAGR